MNAPPFRAIAAEAVMPGLNESHVLERAVTPLPLWRAGDIVGVRLALRAGRG